jgi:hypothetical protein
MKPEETIADLSVIQALAKGMHRWLKQNGRGCFDKQKHVRAGSQEKIYWRYGYMVALMDVKCFLAGKDPNRSRLSRESHNSGSQDRS